MTDEHPTSSTSGVPPAAFELARRTIWVTSHTARWSGMRTQRQKLCDLSLAQLSVLYWSRHDQPILTYLAQRLMVTPRVITGIVDRLEARGYVRRINDPRDRRLTRLELTEAGRETSIAVEHEVAATMANVIAGLDPDEIAELERGLTVLDRVVQRLDPAGLGSDNSR
jgi:DNA-binding MarR family transcriptional regulator